MRSGRDGVWRGAGVLGGLVVCRCLGVAADGGGWNRGLTPGG